jgi:hypothetical protein
MHRDHGVLKLAQLLVGLLEQPSNVSPQNISLLNEFFYTISKLRAHRAAGRGV